MEKLWILCGALFIGVITILILKNVFVSKRKGEKISIYRLLDDRAVSYILGVITTIIGVTLALVITNLDIQNQQREKTKEMIAAACSEVASMEQTLKECYIDVYSDDKQMFVSITSDDLIAPPIILEILLSNQTTAFYMSTTSYLAILDLSRTINLNYGFYDSSRSDYEKYMSIEYLIGNLRILKQVLQNEYLYQLGELTKENLNENISDIYKDNSF